MQRNLQSLAQQEYDLLVVGGGIFGICAAWEAALRGLSVALVERDDFGHATSANSFKMVHGGVRYLQHADLYRVRESSRERSTLLRIAPHLVHPLPIVIPTYGHGKQGKEVLSAGFFLYDRLTFDRNRGIADPQRRIPATRLLSPTEVLELFPHVEDEGLTGGVLFCDGQMYNPTRLALSCLKGAVEAGADVANYVEVVGLLQQGGRVIGVKARDTLAGDRLEIRGRVVVNAAGPWAAQLLQQWMGAKLNNQPSFSRDVCFVVKRRLTDGISLALQAETSDPDALLSRGRRHLFVIPWREYTLVGVWHIVHTGGPEDYSVTEEELQSFINEVNSAYPAYQLTLADVSMVNAGLILFGDNRTGAKNLSFGKRSIIVDHAKEHGLDGLVTLIGVRYTTARGVAANVIDLVGEKLAKKLACSAINSTPVYGGDIQHFSDFARQAAQQRPRTVPEKVFQALLRNHGAAFQEVLAYGAEDPTWIEPLGDSTVLKAEVVHAVRDEMAHSLADVVFRRTDLATGEYPGNGAVEGTALLMAGELGWDSERVERELADVRRAFPPFLKLPPGKETTPIPLPEGW